MNTKLEQLLQKREEIAEKIKKLQKERKAISSHISVIRHRKRKENVI